MAVEVFDIEIAREFVTDLQIELVRATEDMMELHALGVGILLALLWEAFNTNDFGVGISFRPRPDEARPRYNREDFLTAW